MAESLISTRLLEVISNGSAGNGRSPGQPPLPDFQSHFHGHEGGPDRLDVADASSRMGQNLKLGTCGSPHPVKPTIWDQSVRRESDTAPTCVEGIHSDNHLL
jgi:hypothetical protein